MFNLFSKKHDEISVIFDIGNGSIGAALVHFTSGQPPLILYTHREPLAFLPYVNSSRLLDAMLRLLRTVAEHLKKEGIEHVQTHFLGTHTIKNVHCVFSSPWYISQTKVVKVEKETQVVISQKSIEDLIAKEHKLFAEAQKEGKYEQLFGTKVRLLEKKLISTKLNGYEAPDPVGKKAREIEFTFFSSLISEDIISKVERVLHHTFNFNHIDYHSYALASWSTVRDIYPSAYNFLFMDISGEVTDVSLTTGGVLSETITFPFGRSTLLRRLSEELDVRPEVALSYLALNKSKAIDKTATDKIQLAIESVAKDWYEGFKGVVEHLSEHYHVPNTVYLTVDDDMADYFINMLKQDYSPTFMNADTVKVYNHFAPKVKEDSFLTIESIFAQKLFQG